MKLRMMFMFGAAIAVLVSLPACRQEAAPTESHDHETPRVSNRIDVPLAVRDNLGITFATVENRAVRATIRMPGEFELRPEAMREYRAMIPGRVRLHVRQFDRVTPDTPLFSIDSPAWREMQHDAVEAAGAIKLAEAALHVAVATRDEAIKSAAFLRERVQRLAEAGTRNIELESQLAELDNSLPRLEAEIKAREVDLAESREHYESRLRTLASVTGISPQELARPAQGDASEVVDSVHPPRWLAIETIAVTAGIEGVVASINLTEGGWVETGDLIMTAADPTAIRFRAHALQSDIDRVREGQSATIVPPQGSAAVQESIAATLSLGFFGQSDDRTLPVFAIPAHTTWWSRPGVSAFLEVVIEGGAEPELAIPASAVVRDGLSPVIFRRDPNNPNQVIRLEADLGTSDGRWIVIKSGVKAGDEVVLDGAYQLMLASSASSPKGGHFHADGTFHEGNDH